MERVTWWVSCRRFTAKAVVIDGRIVDAAPILRKFIGQPITNLLDWARSLGDYRAEIIS